MISIRVLAAAVLASSGLVLSTPALAAPRDGATVAPWANATVLVKNKHSSGKWSNTDESEQWRRRDGKSDGDRTRTRSDDRQRSNDDGRARSQRTDREWRRDGNRDRTQRSDRSWRRDNDRGRTQRSDRNWRRDGNGNNGNHFGWDRGNHYGWDKGQKRKHWRARQHPRHRYYVGRQMPRVQYVVIHEYNDYYLPPPRRGHYYARVDNDVYLVAEATKLIIDAFVLLDAAGN